MLVNALKRAKRANEAEVKNWLKEEKKWSSIESIIFLSINKSMVEDDDEDGKKVAAEHC